MSLSVKSAIVDDGVVWWCGYGLIRCGVTRSCSADATLPKNRKTHVYDLIGLLLLVPRLGLANSTTKSRVAAMHMMARRSYPWYFAISIGSNSRLTSSRGYPVRET